MGYQLNFDASPKSHSLRMKINDFKSFTVKSV